MGWGPLEHPSRLPVVGLTLSITQHAVAIPRRIDGILRGIESLAVLAENAGALPELTRHAEALSRLADSAASLPELTANAAALAELSQHASALSELTTHAAALAELTQHAGALTELTGYAAALPDLTRHAAALPELTPRVQSVELMVEQIISYLETLQPTVNDLTLAASDLNRAVGPIGRIVGRLPGSKARAEVFAQALAEPSGAGSSSARSPGSPG
ncbi:hypothetical protein DSM112329_04176 [Paraconexibacter sp. AEG42_29]|uniref:MCE family protein n=1 Tax=Paraconexibacter sp. AEG42_29 TaxID=2997339 RepID=A0AAU7B083_9ACTN